MKKIVFILILSCLVLTGGQAVAQSVNQTDSTATDEQIIQRCRQTQSYMNDSLRRRDLRGRVDRLQAYRYMHERLDIYVARLEFNNQPGAAALRTSTTNLDAAITTFKDNYETYDKARDEVVSLQDCEGNYAEFRTRLNGARVKRQQVNASIESIDRLLKDTIAPQLQIAAEAIDVAKNGARQ